MTPDLGAALPDDQDTLLLRAALLPPGDAAPAWRAWRAQVSVEDSPPRVHGLFPLVAENLADDVLGADAAKVQGLRRRAWAVAERLRLRLPGLVQQLDAVGADPRPIRGSAFLLDPGRMRRPVTQLDLQVYPDLWEPAVQALLASGWHVAVARSRSDAGVVLEDADGIRVVVDWAPGFPGALRRPLEPVGTTAHGDARRLLVAVLEGLRPPGYTPLTWPVDATVLAGRLTAADWDDLLAAAVAAGVAPVVGAGLGWAGDQVGARVPSTVLAALAGAPLDPALRRRFHAYAAGEPEPDRPGRRMDMRRAARRYGIDIGLGAPEASLVSPARSLLRAPASPGGPARS